MSVYAARMKRNLRETIEQRDAILERIADIREGLIAASHNDRTLIIALLDYIATGSVSTGDPNLSMEVCTNG